jgi:hypothetical protein
MHLPIVWQWSPACRDFSVSLQASCKRRNQRQPRRCHTTAEDRLVWSAEPYSAPRNTAKYRRIVDRQTAAAKANCKMPSRRPQCCRAFAAVRFHQAACHSVDQAQALKYRRRSIGVNGKVRPVCRHHPSYCRNDPSLRSRRHWSCACSTPHPRVEEIQ